MTRKIRFLSIALAVVLTLALLPGTALAAEEFTIENGVLTQYRGPGGEVTVPAGVTRIGESAFSDYAGHTLTGVTLPEGVTAIEDSAFWGCVKLERVSLPGTLTDIGRLAFAYCRELPEIALPQSLTCIGESAFEGCAALREFTIPGSVTELGPSALRDCDGLTELVIPDSVTVIPNGLFSDCDNLKRVVFPAGAAFQGQSSYAVFQNCPALEELVNPPAFLSQLTAANEDLLEGWLNPGKYVEPQGEAVTALSNQICAGAGSDYEKARAVYRWMAENVVYDYEYYYGRKPSTALTVEAVMEARLTVCAGYTRLTQALLQAQGIPTLYVTGNVYSGDHAWNMAFVEGRWIILDTTWGRPGTMDGSGELSDKGSTYDPSWFDPSPLDFSISHQATSTFSSAQEDIPSDWAQEEVWEAIQAGLVPNSLQGTYRNDITRQEFCALMARLVEKGMGMDMAACLTARGAEVSASFTDTSDPNVLAAHALGIVKGKTGTTFDPTGSITRQEAAAMLERTAKVLGLTAGTAQSYTDAAAIASWASESVAFVSGLVTPAGKAVMGGTGAGGFSPAASYSREQAVLTALRLFQCMG